MVEPGKYIGVYAESEQALEDFFKISMPCGYNVTYSLNTFPRVDTPCPCGNPDHWLVKIGGTNNG